MERETATSMAGTGDGPGGRSASWRSTLACSASALASRASRDSGRSPAVSLCLALSRNISEYLGISGKKCLRHTEISDLASDRRV